MNLDFLRRYKLVWLGLGAIVAAFVWGGKKVGWIVVTVAVAGLAWFYYSMTGFLPSAPTPAAAPDRTRGRR